MSIRGWRKRAVVGLASVFLGAASLIAVGAGGSCCQCGRGFAPSGHELRSAFPTPHSGPIRPVPSPAVLSNSGSTDTIDLNTDLSFSGPGADDYVITAWELPWRRRIHHRPSIRSVFYSGRRFLSRGARKPLRHHDDPRLGRCESSVRFAYRYGHHRLLRSGFLR